MNFLIIDDEFVSLSKLTMFLGNYGKCDSVTNGKQAIDIYNQSVSRGKYYDLIIFDINLPDLNGLELFKKIKIKEEKLKIPIAKKIIISANGSPYNVSVAAKIHCDAFIIKPFKNDVLRDKLLDISILKSKKSTFQKSSNTNTLRKVIKDNEQNSIREDLIKEVTGNNIENEFLEPNSDTEQIPVKENMTNAERYEMKLKIKQRKREIFKFCLQDQAMNILLEAVVEEELRRELDE